MLLSRWKNLFLPAISIECSQFGKMLTWLRSFSEWSWYSKLCLIKKQMILIYLDAADRPLDLSLKKTGRRRNSVEHSVLNVHASLVPAHILPAQAESKSHMWKWAIDSLWLWMSSHNKRTRPWVVSHWQRQYWENWKKEHTHWRGWHAGKNPRWSKKGGSDRVSKELTADKSSGNGRGAQGSSPYYQRHGWDVGGNPSTPKTKHNNFFNKNVWLWIVIS